jgi:hypothetical protein
VLQAVEAQLARRDPYRWDRIVAVAALATMLLGGALNWHAGVRHEREMARLFGPRCLPDEIVELQSTIAAVTDNATAARYAASLGEVHSESAKTVPSTVCSLTIEIVPLAPIWKGKDHENTEESTQMDGTGYPAGRGGASCHPLDQAFPIGQTA